LCLIELIIFWICFLFCRFWSYLTTMCQYIISTKWKKRRGACTKSHCPCRPARIIIIIIPEWMRSPTQRIRTKRTQKTDASHRSSRCRRRRGKQYKPSAEQSVVPQAAWSVAGFETLLYVHNTDGFSVPPNKFL